MSMSLVCVMLLAFAGDSTEATAKDAIARSRKLGVDAECLIPELVGVYQALLGDDSLSRSRRDGLLGAVRYRLIELGDRIVIRYKRSLDTASDESPDEDADQAEQLPQVPDYTDVVSYSDSLAGSDPETPGAAGGSAEFKRAQELIELIRRTIAPQSWDVVGGQGSIYYFQQTHSLVIRQTAEVHWLIGGLRQALGN